MSAPLALRVATHLMVFDGIVGLFLSGLLSAPSALLVGVVVAASWWHGPVRDRIAAAPRGGQVLLLLVALASAIDLLYIAETMLDGLVRLLIVLLVYRLIMRRTLRDVRDAGFLSFFMLVAAAPLTLSVGFFFVLLAFLVLGTWTLMLFHVLAEAERAAKPLRLPALGRSLFGLSLIASVATLLITAGLFFLIPRVGQAALPLRAQLGRMVSGFSERVEMGAFGEIEVDGSIIMRVHPAPGTPAPEPFGALRWRGIAFDHFDGRVWTSRDPERTSVGRSRYGQFDLGVYRGAGPLVAYEVYLEPLGTEILFAAPRVVRLGARTDTIVVDDMGSISAAAPAARLQYVVQSELERDDFVDRVESREPLDEASRARYLQLPELPERIRALAAEITAGSRDPLAAALRLTDYLHSRRFRYTTVLERQTALDPIEEFLFVRRAGNCEYFAAALAVMLRSVGIPARVVNGFQRGEWNPYGRYFMVRLRDAHSWVEAHLAGRWRTLDPSPRGEPEVAAGPSLVWLYLDALRMRWYRYVIDWSLQDQVAAAFKIRQATFAWRPRLAAAVAWRDPRLVVAALVVVAAVVACVVWRRRGDGPGRPSGARTPRFYARTLKALARRGYRPEPGETAREFALRVEASLPACAGPLGRLTSAYEQVRFGGAPFAPETVADLERSVIELRPGH